MNRQLKNTFKQTSSSLILRISRSSTDSLAFGSRYGKSHLRSRGFFLSRYEPSVRLTGRTFTAGEGQKKLLSVSLFCFSLFRVSLFHGRLAFPLCKTGTRCIKGCNITPLILWKKKKDESLWILLLQEWRVPELLYRHLDQVLPHIHHPYKNMRDRIGSVLTSIHMYDWTFPGGNKCRFVSRQKWSRELTSVTVEFSCLISRLDSGGFLFLQVTNESEFHREDASQSWDPQAIGSSGGEKGKKICLPPIIIQII